MLLVLAGAFTVAQAQTNTVQTNTVQTNTVQTNAVQVRKMSLEDCIAVSLGHNLDIEIQRYNPDLAFYTLESTYGAYDPVLSAAAEHDYTVQAGGFDPQGRPFGGLVSDANSVSTTLQGLAPWGMTYTLGGNLSDTYGTQPVSLNGFVFRSPFESASSRVGLFQLRQPLLRNLWIDSTRLALLVNKANLKISELGLRLQVMNTVTAVENAYWNLIYAQEDVQVQRKALELAERLLAENKKKVEIGALAPLDEKQAESQAASSRADLLASLGTEDTQQRVLKSLLSDDYSEWKDVSVAPTEALYAVPEKFDLQDSWHKGVTMRPDLLQAKLSVEKQGYQVRYNKNQMFPQLDLVGSAGWSGSSPNGVGSVFDQLRGRDNPFWTAGGQFSIPLGNIGARYNYKSAKATKEQLELQMKQLEQNILILIENAIATAQTSFQRVDATREARIYAAAALDAEQKKLDSGKSTSFQVLQLQKDLTTARSAEIRALADYNIALAQIALNEGSTLERRKVTLELK
jgi:outer membrane protein TolC